MRPQHTLAKIVLSASVLLLTGAGCITVSSDGATAQGSDGGIFKTGTKGDAWVQTVAVPTTTGEKKAISGVNVASITQDPSDPNALYLGTAESGMFFTYDAGASWYQPAQLSRGRVAAVSVDAKSKCTIFAVKDNVVVKTVDCSRTWSVMYIDARQNAAMTAVVVDHFSPNIVWAANASGDLLKSEDGGASWTNAKTFIGPIVRLAMHSADSRTLYVATKAAGVWRTKDGGATWVDLSERYATFSGAKDFYDLSLGISESNAIVLATKYGLIRSGDAGETWRPIELLTPPGNAIIYSVAIDPRDPNAVYYGTATNFYRSPNGGVNWVTKKLPSGRTPTALLVDRANPDVLYMGVTRFNK